MASESRVTVDMTTALSCAVHPLPEIRLRGAKSLLFKLKNGLVGSSELVGGWCNKLQINMDSMSQFDSFAAGEDRPFKLGR